MKNAIFISIPENVSQILDKLNQHGFQGYVVGGAVRDSLLNIKPKDFDICTNALPEQIKDIFKDYNVILTGEKHGTVTVMIEHIPIEVTTFRLDGNYSDNRHPDSVKFTVDLYNDLARRDFTINAMAYNHNEGLIDPYNGQFDLSHGLIRCVGDANLRFKEDALRMLRAIRFSARLEFMVTMNTGKAIYVNAHLIKNVSEERIQAELNQIIIHNTFYLNMLNELRLLDYILPELKNCIKVEQNNPFHYLDVYGHILAAVNHIEPNVTLRLTMLLHDIAKPIAKTTDGNGKNHFYDHPQLGATLAVEALRRLKYDNHTIMRVRTLIEIHDCMIPANKKSIKKWLNKIGEETFRDLLKVKYADMMAQSKFSYEFKHKHWEKLGILLEEVLAEKECFSKKDLAINGSDLIAMGLKEGKLLGIIIDTLVKQVIESPELNDRETLLLIVAMTLEKENIKNGECQT